MSGTAPAPSVAEPEPTTANDESAGPSKSELKKRAKEAEKAKKVSERAAREEDDKKKREATMSVDHAAQNYGKLPMHQSQERRGTFPFPQPFVIQLKLTSNDPGRSWFKFSQMTDELVGQPVIFRARLHNMRLQGESSI